MQAIESTLEIHGPEGNIITTKRRKNKWFDYEVDQLKSKRRAAVKNA